MVFDYEKEESPIDSTQCADLLWGSDNATLFTDTGERGPWTILYFSFNFALALKCSNEFQGY